MPTYGYTCTVCGHSFDVRQSFDDAPLTVCPECSGKLRKVFSPVGVVFKGSGFYRTDARSSGKGTTSAPSGEGTTSASSPSSATPSSTSSSSSTPSSSSGATSTTTSSATAGASASKAAHS